jgi:methionyl aminopeptidase
MSYVEICERVEAGIRHRGAQPAFPCNVCVNSVAAHYTAEIGDTSAIQEDDVVKVDIGAHVDGWIADTATTVAFAPQWMDLVAAAEEVLAEAVRVVRAGMPAGEIGRVIAAGAERRGYRPIANLSGHLIEPYQIHAGVSIPNVWAPRTPALKAAAVYAIEPFLTPRAGAGLIVEGNTRNIFSLLAQRRTGRAELDVLLREIWERFRTLPFAARFLADGRPKAVLGRQLDDLVRLRALRAYPTLIEPRGLPVAQAEHTVVPTEGGATIVTKAG